MRRCAGRRWEIKGCDAENDATASTCRARACVFAKTFVTKRSSVVKMELRAAESGWGRWLGGVWGREYGIVWERLRSSSAQSSSALAARLVAAGAAGAAGACSANPYTAQKPPWATRPPFATPFHTTTYIIIHPVYFLFHSQPHASRCVLHRNVSATATSATHPPPQPQPPRPRPRPSPPPEHPGAHVLITGL